MKITSVRPCRDELDNIALRAAGGDRAAESAAIELVTPMVMKVVATVLNSKWRFRRHRDELIQDAFLAAIECIRRYDGRGKLSTYLMHSVRCKVLTAARLWLSPVGARAPETKNIDLTTAVFKDYTSDCALVASQCDTAYDEYAHREARLRLMDRLRQLTSIEKDVVLRRWGVPVDRPSMDRGTKELHARPESLDEIGADYGVTGEAVRKIQRGALKKLGVEDGPGKVFKLSSCRTSQSIAISAATLPGRSFCS